MVTKRDKHVEQYLHLMEGGARGAIIQAAVNRLAETSLVWRRVLLGQNATSFVFNGRLIVIVVGLGQLTHVQLQAEYQAHRDTASASGTAGAKAAAL